MGTVCRNLLVCLLAVALVCDSTHPVNGASRPSAHGAARTAKNATSNHRRVQPVSRSGSAVAAFWAAHRAPLKASPKRLIRSEKLVSRPAIAVEKLVGRPAIAAEINAGGSAGARIPHGPKFAKAQRRRTRIIERTPSSFLGMESDVVETIKMMDDPSPEEEGDEPADQDAGDEDAEKGKVENLEDAVEDLAKEDAANDTVDDEDEEVPEVAPKEKQPPMSPGQGPRGPPGPAGEVGPPGMATNITEDMPALIKFKRTVVSKEAVYAFMLQQLFLGLLAWCYFSGAAATMKSTIMKKKLAEAATKAAEAEAAEAEAAAKAEGAEGEGEGEGGES